MSRRRTKERDEQHEAKQKAPPPTKRRAASFKKTTKENATTTSSLTSDFLTIASTLIPLLLAVLALLCLPTVLGEDRGGEILDKALLKAFKGGIPGFFAATIQILSLMWLRTIINYQYKTGAPFMLAFRTLYKEGGVRRFYRGFIPAVALVPLSRFGDTASNGTPASLHFILFLSS